MWIENDSAAKVNGSPVPVLAFTQAGSSGFGVVGWANASIIESSTTGGLVLDAYGSNGGPITFQIGRTNRMTINTSGFVGIGTTDPGAALEVSGTGIKLTRGSGGSITFQDGTIQSTAFIPAN